MTKTTRNVLLIVLAVVLLIAGTVFVINYYVFGFFRAFAPQEITVTKTAISTNREFINAITIEKLKVDSFSGEQPPVKYVIEYRTTCFIKHPENAPPEGLKKIRLTKPGRYYWTEEKVNIPVVHTRTYRERNDEGMLWSLSEDRVAVCPLTFEKGNWYFITIGDPQIVGIYVYIDSNDELHQHTVFSEVSPI